jgi:hypothetical protein
MNRQTLNPALKPTSLQSLSRLTGELRRAVSAQLMHEFGVQLTPPLIRRVVDEASDLAQETGFPNLFFPALAQEKARLVFASLRHPSFDQAPSILRRAA